MLPGPHHLNPRLRYLSPNPDAAYRLEVDLRRGQARVVWVETGVQVCPAHAAWLPLRPPGCEANPDSEAIDAYLQSPEAQECLGQIRAHYDGFSLHAQGLLALLKLQTQLWALPTLHPDKGYWFAPEWFERHPPVLVGKSLEEMAEALIAGAALEDVLLDREEVCTWLEEQIGHQSCWYS
ncbi:MAG: hypothetical protein KatS3mg071_1728 [Meiothermus sp.]|jgi:hypothetical protein|nr:MAG: hypothetical protein KatS3mg071_1728 [Meiothermus sp.]